jgi:hypothetical protein
MKEYVPPQTQQDIIKRKNYYQSLGIAQRGSRETDRVSRMTAKSTSGIDMSNAEGSGLAMTKSKSFIDPDASKNKAEDELDTLPKFGEKNSHCPLTKNNRDGFEQALDEIPQKQENDSMFQVDDSTEGTEYTVAINTRLDSNSIQNDILEESKEDQFEIDLTTPKAQAKDSQGVKIDLVSTNKVRTDEEMRRKFLGKLTQEKIWLTPSEKPKVHQT